MGTTSTVAPPEAVETPFDQQADLESRIPWHERPQQKAADPDALREAKLAMRWQQHGDFTARDALVKTYQYIAGHSAWLYRGYIGFEQQDLEAEGMMALLQSIDTFNPERGRFAPFATFKVRVAIQEYVMANWSVVNVWHADKRRVAFFNLSKIRRELGVKDYFSFEQAEEAAKLLSQRFRKAVGMTADDVLFMEQLLHRDSSLNQKTRNDEGEHAGEIQDLVPCTCPTAEECLLHGAVDPRMIKLQAAINDLEPRMRTIIIRHRLAEGDARCTLKELAVKLKVSAERVRQLERMALRNVCAALDIPFKDDILKQMKKK